MKQYKVVSITDTGYPLPEEESAAITRLIEGILPRHKEDSRISCLRDHSVTMTWIAGNLLLTTLVTSDVLLLPTAVSEAFFKASRGQLAFP